MNNKSVVAGVVFGVGVAIAVTRTWQSYLDDLQKRFPDLDRKVLKKAYKQFMRNAAADKYGPMADFSDATMDALFLKIVHEQTTSR
jgi:hypothetical protein